MRKKQHKTTVAIDLEFVAKENNNNDSPKNSKMPEHFKTMSF
jgi:hypothetical protein